MIKERGFSPKLLIFSIINQLMITINQGLKKRPFIKTPKRNKALFFTKKYSIQEVIKSNQVILIQVVKEERGNKGAAVTTRLSLAGKYCVLMPNTK